MGNESVTLRSLRGGRGNSVRSLRLSKKATRLRRLTGLLGQGVLLLITSASALAVFFIFLYIAKDALPFFLGKDFAFWESREGWWQSLASWWHGLSLGAVWARVKEFFTSTEWYPTQGQFGAAAMFVGSALVTLGAVVVAVPLGVAAAVCLSDVLPFSIRQVVKPVVEVLAAIPSVAYGFFALVVFAPWLQQSGGPVLAAGLWLVGAPLALLVAVVVSDLTTSRLGDRPRAAVRMAVMVALAVLAVCGLWLASRWLFHLQIASGANALNVSIILGIMTLPTVVSVSEDALQAVGRELREGSYALGATRAETVLNVVIPAAASGIGAAVILGIMRAIGETMVVWMASGNAAQVPKPWFNFLDPVRTLTATIAGDMGEADQMTGSDRYHVLFAMALCLLVFSYFCNAVSEWFVRRTRRKLRGE